jgi:RND family efflux transporter MFP subunit
MSLRTLIYKQSKCSASLASPACLLFLFTAIAIAGCSKPPAGPAAAPQQAMPVQVTTVALKPVPASDMYVATVKSRRSATMQSQVEGKLIRILVHSGQRVSAEQLLLEVDPLRQTSIVQQQEGAEAQQKAAYEYNKSEVERQRQLFESGLISRQAYDQAVQSFQNSTGAYHSSSAQTASERQQLAYYQIRAPFAGLVGDVPVHLGDYVTGSTVLTTVDDTGELEAYIYIPTERGSQIRMGLPVELFGTDGRTLAHSTINFISPQVDNGLQSILAKAAIPRTAELLRNAQLVKARVTWSSNPAPTVPVLAVTRISGQAFVFVAAPNGNAYAAHQVPVTLGDTVGNDYPVLSGLKQGDKVILSSIQYLQEGMPVAPAS